MATPVTDRLLSDAKEIWEGYHTHPFVSGIADGSLEIEKFKFYLIQDYLYLFDYTRVFAMGVVKACNPDVMRVFANYIHQILNGETQIHRAYMERLGIPRHIAEAAQPAITNLSYTAYMRTVAQEEGIAEIMAAILSCALSYEQIAEHIVSKHPTAAEHPFYGEWIRGYASSEYAEGNRALTALFEQLCADYNDKQITRLCNIFVTCSRYEGMFWDMAWNMER